MKCMLNKVKNLKIIMFIGLALMFAGIGAMRLLGEDASAAAYRMAGFFAGIGFSLVVVAGAWLIYKRVVGAQRARDKELEMGDERGQAINMKAQAMIGFVATFIVIAINIVALVRGDGLYMALCTAGCFIIAITGFVARAVLGEKL